jgi:hypothetical protein
MLLKSATITEELLEKKAYADLLEMERRREEGIAQARFDAGGLEGGNLAEQGGGEPESIVPAEDVASDNLTPEIINAPEDKSAETKPVKRERKKPEIVAVEEKPTETLSSAKRRYKKEAPAEQVVEGEPTKRTTKKVAAPDEPEEVQPPKRGRPKKVVADSEKAKEKPKSPQKK